MLGGSKVDTILIPSDDEFDNEFDLDGRSDISFELLGGLLPDARNNVESCRVPGTGKGVDAASDDYNAPEPSVTSMTGPTNESYASPIALHMELASLTSHDALPCGPESSCRRGDGCDRYPHLSVYYRRC